MRTVHMRALAAVLVVLAVAARGAAAGSVCALYTTCVDCACATSDYTVDDACDSGCEWNSALSLCASAGTYNGDDVYTTLWMVPDAEELLRSAGTGVAQDKRMEWVKEGKTTCDVAHGAGTVVTIILVLTLAGVFQVGLLAGYVRFKLRMRENTSAAGRAWITSVLHDHVPEGEAVLWEGVSDLSKARTGSGKITIIFMVLSAMPMMIPSFVWMGIGLPYVVSVYWDFDFYYPILFVGGLGTLFSMLLVGSVHSAPAQRLSAYALTTNHSIVVHGDAGKRTLEGRGCGITSSNIREILTSERSDSMVKFTATSSAVADGDQSVKVTEKYEHLSPADAHAAFAALQARRGAVTVPIADPVAPATDTEARQDPKALLLGPDTEAPPLV